MLDLQRFPVLLTLALSYLFRERLTDFQMLPFLDLSVESQSGSQLAEGTDGIRLSDEVVFSLALFAKDG